MQLTRQQQQFFDTFGYLVFPGLFKADIEAITTEFRAVFDDRGIAHDAKNRTCLVPFIDQRERLCALIDDSRIDGIAAGLLGPAYSYTVSDGNYYTGDTNWHSDGNNKVNTHIKIAFYLDEVGHESGALRVIPGSHRRELFEWQGRGGAGNASGLWGIEARDVPSVTLESTPGDVVVFNHSLMHASFGGSTQRRMFTANFCSRVESPEEIENLKQFIAGTSRFWIDHMHGAVMRNTAGPERMRHLSQVIEHEGHLAGLSAKARETMAEPARA